MWGFYPYKLNFVTKCLWSFWRALAAWEALSSSPRADCYIYFLLPSQQYKAKIISFFLLFLRLERLESQHL